MQFGERRALAGARTVVEATYDASYLAHAQLEPPSALARWNDDGTFELWVPNQVAPEKVLIHSPGLGGFFGPHCLCQTANPYPQAIALAKPAAAWGAVAAMALCVVALIASEFMPASLLTPIAGELGLSEGQTGSLGIECSETGYIAARRLRYARPLIKAETLLVSRLGKGRGACTGTAATKGP